MRTGTECHTVKINSCPSEHYWFNNHIGEPVIVADSGESDEWYIVTGTHEGKQVLKSVCSPAEMTLIDLGTDYILDIEKVSA